MNIPAIETHYRGHKFRSRTEARWAVFFDALGLRWEYEKEGFDLRLVYESWFNNKDDKDGRYPPEKPNSFKYLPDFYLPEMKMWIEVKPLITETITVNPITKLPCNPYTITRNWPDNDTSAKADLLGMSENKVLVAMGLPGSFHDDTYHACLYFGGWSDDSQYFGYCPVCKTIGVGYCGWAERICPNYELCGHHRKENLSRSSPIARAYEASRAARFESNNRQRLKVI